MARFLYRKHVIATPDCAHGLGFVLGCGESLANAPITMSALDPLLLGSQIT